MWLNCVIFIVFGYYYYVGFESRDYIRVIFVGFGFGMWGFVR